MEKYMFWNNKGGTGKTSLAFQTICAYSNLYKNKNILVIDVCPQANLSELFLGGLTGDGASNLLSCHGKLPRASIGGYFEKRLPSPYLTPDFSPQDFITSPNKHNKNIPENISLLCGDPLLELQGNAIITLANQKIPSINPWIKVVDWLKDFIEKTKYDTIFLDGNPSFSFYTQIALSASNKLILPTMADDSSRRAIQNAFSLIYGLKLPSDIYLEHAFRNKLDEESRPLPKIHLIAKNRITQYMGPASAYASVLKTIDDVINSLLDSNPEIFSEKEFKNIIEIRDFQTTGVVSFARGCPFFKLNTGYLSIGTQRIQVNKENLENCQKAIDRIVETL